MTLIYVSPRNGEWSLKMKFEPSFNFPWGSKQCQSASKLPVVRVTAPSLSLRGEELDAPEFLVGTSTLCDTAHGWERWAGPNCLWDWKERGRRRIILCVDDFMVLRKACKSHAGLRKLYCLWDLSWSPWAPCSLLWGGTGIALVVPGPLCSNLAQIALWPGSFITSSPVIK